MQQKICENCKFFNKTENDIQGYCWELRKNVWQYSGEHCSWFEAVEQTQHLADRNLKIV